ncbi:MAG: PAS domain-containing protein [Desulfobacteraceae bacterium]|nr:MAG: PAS domain-containing protein [Desulfobacteraceae bacterium]
MTDKIFSIINIALVGGGNLCKELLEKTTFDLKQEDVFTPIIAVADPDDDTPGMSLAKKRGLITVEDYHDLYDPRYSIHLIIILRPEQFILEDILATRPTRIRILSYHVFEIFWKAIGQEERKLREQNKAMETILNGIQDFISVITPDMTIEDANESFLSNLELSRDKVIGRKCYEVLQRDSINCTNIDQACPLNEVVRNKGPTRQVRTQIGRRGKVHHIEVHIYPVWEKDGKIAKFIHISRDITARMEEEEEITRRLEQMVEERTSQLKETHEKLIHKDKMASLGKLSASVVHEINNPIAGILNLILLIKRIIRENPVGMKDLKEFSRYLDLMENETRRTSRIVSYLLAFSRQNKMELRPLNLNNLIENNLFLNSNLLKINNVKVQYRPDKNMPEIVGSEDQLQQVIMNLVSNAVESVESKGRGILTIETKYFSRKKRIAATFKDTGIGIPQENLTRIFEPFFTTKKQGKGVGLGLSLAYGIVQDHGGAIHVDSKIGKGTSFKIDLPLRH